MSQSATMMMFEARRTNTDTEIQKEIKASKQDDDRHILVPRTNRFCFIIGRTMVGFWAFVTLATVVLLAPSASAFSVLPAATTTPATAWKPLGSTNVRNGIKPLLMEVSGDSSSSSPFPVPEYRVPISDKTIRESLDKVDNVLLSRLVRVGNHIPAAASLAYFGLVSMASMMPAMHAQLRPTLTSVLTQAVGATTNAQFAAYFPTLVTPPSFIFLVWPLIATVQFVTIAISAFLTKTPLLSQDTLTALSLTNLASSSWLLVSSSASPGALPLASFSVLPLVPWFAAYPLRRLMGIRSADKESIGTNEKTEADKPTLQNFVFQLYSGFTTLAAILAFAVELQHGGRVPFVKDRPEVAAFVFLALSNFVVNRSRSVVRKTVNTVAICGILWKRIGMGLPILTSFSFYGTAFVAINAIQKLVGATTERATDE